MEKTFPAMALNPDKPHPLTAPPPPFPKDLPHQQRAAERFAIKGNAIVTGAAGILGFQAVNALLEHGASGVALLDVKSPVEAADAIRASFPDRKVFAKQVDLTEATAVNEATAAAVIELGSVDVLCTFAGIAHHSSCLEMTPEEFRKTMDINVTASFLASQAAAKHMIAQGRGGSIVLIASIAAHAVLFPQPQIAYNTSKAAVLQLRASLAAELAQHGIRVNSISPGYMNTPMLDACSEDVKRIWRQRNPMGRIGEPGELMAPLVLLCSKIGGSYVNGADLIVDGGGNIL